MEIIKYFIIIYYIMLNLSGFLSMGIDKRKAIKKGWRISERTLLFIAFLGGGIGSLIGMRFFHHKTKHLKFVLLVPLSVLIYILLLFYIMKQMP